VARTARALTTLAASTARALAALVAELMTMEARAMARAHLAR
jgi:hypothetical protein